MINLEVVTGGETSPEERRRLARTIFRNFGRSVVDFLKLPSLDAAALAREIQAEGLDRLEAALRPGGGAILLTGHLGGWEMGGAYLSSLGYRVHAIAQEHDDPRVNEFFNQRRRARGLRVVGRSENGASLLRFLKQGECLALLGDWDPGGRGVWATFFGRAARVPSAYVGLASRSGGRILPGVALRNPEGGYRIRLDEPIAPTPGDERATLEGCLKVLERHISENLTQWYAFNPIWPEQAADERVDS
jgi:KDO2-lipid IV(A) lauroyltransferase